MDWSTKVSAKVSLQLKESRYNKPVPLPDKEDMVTLANYLDSKSASAMSGLKEWSERALKLLGVRPDGSLGDVGPCIPTRRECEHFHALPTRRAESEALADADAYDTILDHNASWDVPNVQGEMLKPDEGTLSARVFSVEVTALARALPPNPTTEQVREVLWSLPCLCQKDPQNE
ncbi:Polyprotein P1234, partial [Frankliniella fusca]